MNTNTTVGSNFITAERLCSTNSRSGTASVNISWPEPDYPYSLRIVFAAVKKLA